MNKLAIISIVFISFCSAIKAQTYTVTKTINWAEKKLIANSEKGDDLTKIYGIYAPGESFNQVGCKFMYIEYQPLTPEEKKIVSNYKLADKITIDKHVGYERKKPFIQYSFVPFRINRDNNLIEKVSKYSIGFELSTKTLKSVSTRQYASSSLLKDGNWYKFKIDTSGIFKLSYDQLIQMGLSEPKNVRIYSYGGKQLPYANAEANYDDLNEIPIKMVKGSDGEFNSGDYIIFYGEGTYIWNYDAEMDLFYHSKHNFSNFTYLFLTDFFGDGGIKIKEVDNQTLSPNYTTSSFDSYKCHEKNHYNLIESGRTWYGEKFRPGNSETFNFTFPNIISSEKVKIHTSVAGRKQIASQACYFKLSYNNLFLGNIDISEAYSTYTYAHEYSRLFNINNPSATISLKFDFLGASSIMEAYIDYINVNAREKLAMQGHQFFFCDKNTATPGRISKFDIDNAGKSITVWDITNSEKPFELKLANENTRSSFISPTDTLHYFVAFEGSDYLTPIINGDDVGLIENQNLHGVGNYDMIIITHPLFQSQAEELANIHREKDGFKVLVTQPQTIYNEFSSGTPDISAIRNFVRMLYDKAQSDEEMPEYLLLFGDGSYDNWTTGHENSNYIPTYQNINSVSETASYVSDDYYGLLDDGEGEVKSTYGYRIVGALDISIGRFPVRTVEEAELMITKIKHYISPQSFGDWKTRICFIGDDDDNGAYMTDANKLAENTINFNHPEYNINKIYLDAFKQTSTPSGQRFPDVTRAINENVEQGALIIDYVGHGNPRILAHEEILSVPDVLGWKNWDKLSVFITASCEVGRYDDFERYSLGEWLLLNPKGGGIAAITTTRVVYNNSNFYLNQSILQNAFNTDLRLGDIIKIAKNERPNSEINHRNFSLLGDPALKLAVPKNKIVVGLINNNFLPVNNISTPVLTGNKAAEMTQTTLYEPGDTINALSKARVEGYIEDFTGKVIDNDGVLYITVYDKTDTLFTYGQDNAPIEFTIQDKLLYKGKASIKQGYFAFDFIVPKDINYKFGRGKISLYAVLDSVEAIGFSQNIVIGGNAELTETDFTGPEISLFMNDTLFVSGGITNENPVLIAQLKDDTGINTTGNGFGHNITAILDGNQDNIYMLNNFYEGNIDEYNSGEVKYPFWNLTTGYHHIELKTFDIYNNSTLASIEFYVQNSNNLVIAKMYNTPNPFYDETEFRFEHNLAFDAFEINIKIYDIMGNKVTELSRINSGSGYSIAPITWNGTNSLGAKLPRGVYIYHTEITATDGRKTNKSSKLMIFK